MRSYQRPERDRPEFGYPRGAEGRKHKDAWSGKSKRWPGYGRANFQPKERLGQVWEACSGKCLAKDRADHLVKVAYIRDRPGYLVQEEGAPGRRRALGVSKGQKCLTQRPQSVFAVAR